MIIKLFPGQQEDEKIFLIIRQHWFVFFRKFLGWLIFLAILIIGDRLVKFYLSDFLKPPYVNIVNLVELVYLMFLLLGLFILWIIYYLNIQIVTNERVVDITQKSLLNHTISELHLNRIQDVTAEVHGLLPTMLDYGNVYLQTAAETERFTFQDVPNPTKVSKLILNLYEQLPQEEKIKGAED